MIPPINESGCLPPGVHRATLAEIETLVGTQSEIRRVQKELRRGLPFLDIALVDQKEFDRLVGQFFAADRRGTPKGMVEIIL